MFGMWDSAKLSNVRDAKLPILKITDTRDEDAKRALDFYCESFETNAELEMKLVFIARFLGLYIQ